MLGLVLAVCIKALWRQLSQLPQASEPWPVHSKLGVTFTLGHSGDTEGHVHGSAKREETGHWSLTPAWGTGSLEAGRTFWRRQHHQLGLEEWTRDGGRLVPVGRDNIMQRGRGTMRSWKIRRWQGEGRRGFSLGLDTWGPQGTKYSHKCPA